MEHSGLSNYIRFYFKKEVLGAGHCGDIFVIQEIKLA